MPADLRERLQAALGTTYRLERELAGGMSRVFVAREAALDRPVVIKVLPPETSQTVSADRFRREIALAAQLQHPHIVPVLTAGEADGLLYYTMPLVEGESLRARLGTGARLGTTEALRILRDVASALAFAHQKGIVHRDIKPDNVLLAGDSATVADFGIAKALAASSQQHVTLTTQGLALGTPTYMAPEQAAGDDVDGRADLYALGAMAYELFTGCPPFQKPTPQAMLIAHAVERPKPLGEVRPDLPGALTRLVDVLLEKKPADRPASADDVVRSLDAVGTPSGGTATVRVQALARRRSWIPVAVVAVVAAGVFFLMRTWRTSPAAPVERRSVLLVPFAGKAPDSSLSAVVTQALRSDLGQSPVVALVSDDQRAAALRRMERDPATPLDLTLARDLAQREGVAAIVAGEVTGVGGQVLLLGRIVDPVSGQDIATFRETAKAETDVVDAIDRLSKEVRQRLGESARSLRAATPLAHATTSSLEALRDYTLAMQLKERFSTSERARDLLEEAVRLDSSFALAWRELAGLRAKAAARSEAARLAMALRDRLSPVEQAMLEAWYYETFQFDLDRSLRAYTKVTELDSMNVAAWSGLSAILQVLGRDDSAVVRTARRALVISDNAPSRFQDLAEAELALGDTAAARSVLDSLSMAMPNELEAKVSQIMWNSHFGRFRQADSILDGVLPKAPWLLVVRRNLLLLQGKVAQAAQVQDQLARQFEEAARPEAALRSEFEYIQLRSRLLGPSPALEKRVDAALRRFPPERMNPEDPEYAWLATGAAWAGRTTLAREFLKRWVEVRQAGLGRDTLNFLWAQADILLAEGKYRESAALQTRWGRLMPGLENSAPHIAHPYDLAGEADSAIKYYTRFLSRTTSLGNRLWWLDVAHRAETFEALARNYENKQQPDSAAKYYQALLDMWKDADPEMEPRKKSIRDALARVTAEREGVPIKTKS